MKSLDERLSAVVSPFDEDMSQEDLLYDQHLQYQKDAVLESIGTNRAKIEFDLHLEEVIEKLQKGTDYCLFLEDCLKKLSEEYYLDVLLDYIQRKGIMSNPDSVLELIKFFVYDEWLENLVYCLPNIDASILNNYQTIQKIISESFLSIQNKIIVREDINPLVRFYFTFCPEENGIKTLIKMVMMDFSGVISTQMLKQLVKQERL